MLQSRSLSHAMLSLSRYPQVLGARRYRLSRAPARTVVTEASVVVVVVVVAVVAVVAVVVEVVEVTVERDRKHGLFLLPSSPSNPSSHTPQVCETLEQGKRRSSVQLGA